MATQPNTSRKKITQGALSEVASGKIIRRMKELNVSQASLARAAGMHQTGVSDVLNRTRRPAFDQMAAMARRLGVSLDWLADDEAGEDAPGRFKDEAWEDIQDALDTVRRLDKMLSKAPQSTTIVDIEAEVDEPAEAPKPRRKAARPRGKG